MLINLWSEPDDGTFKFDLPALYFRPRQLVCVTKFYIIWKEKSKPPLLSLTSTLVDKSPINPNQQLICFGQEKSSNYIYVTPTLKEYYKIQCLDFQASQFDLINLLKEDLPKIDKIYLQLEIVDARIQ